MPVVGPEKPRVVLFNLPNQLTTLRLILSVVLFAMIEFQWYLASTILFTIAAGTDWLDGYYARKYSMITTLGRILDPFVDKVIVCGTFTYLLAINTAHTVPAAAGGTIALDSGVRAWMVVVILGRELLVTALRSFLEQQGADFSATLSGKLKMVVQCVSAAYCLFYVYLTASFGTPAMAWTAGRDVLLWATVILTVVSGLAYLRAALGILKEQRQA
jgi:CDP-diacylglycerol--glycerol-3-phosphate 3-phosphatidyltransferase